MSTDPELRRRALGGLLRFQACLTLMVMLPAWDWGYWQGWTFLGVFGGCNLVITLYFLRHDPALIRRRLSVGARAETLPRQKKLQAIAGLLVAALVLVPGFDHHWHGSDVPAVWVFAAELLLIACMALIFCVFRANSFTAATVVVEPGQQLADRGPYAWVRHPMYLGAMIAFPATAIALASWYALLITPALSSLLILRLLHEEEHLGAELPGYVEYQTRVRHRLVPMLW